MSREKRIISNKTTKMQHPILLFDGVCNLCNSTVQFVIGQDKRAVFRFASLQSDIAQRLLKENNVTENNLNSVILIYGGRYYAYSSAVLEMLRLLGGFWQLLYIFKLVPSFLRDPIYRFVAAHRYRWFGKQESCWLPTAELKSRFLA
jgi:predicted DCC family thiol-disulfide oxidoreductase YuxK